MNRFTLTASMLTVSLLAGCTSSSQPPAPQASGAASATVSSEQAEAASGALAAYHQFREYSVKAMTTGQFSRDEMQGFAGEPKLGTSIQAFDSQRRNGITFSGRPTWSPRAASVDLKASPPVVVIDDCFDTGAFTPIKDGKPVPAPSGTLTRVVVTMKVKKVDGRWYVYEDLSPRSKPC